MDLFYELFPRGQMKNVDCVVVYYAHLLGTFKATILVVINQISVCQFVFSVSP